MPAAKALNAENKMFTRIAKKFKTITKEPEKFLVAQPDKYDAITELLQDVYKKTSSSDIDNRKNAEVLPELFVEQMDDEQIWQQLELRNDLVLNQFIEETAKMLAIKEEKLEIQLDEGDEENDESGSDDEDDDEDLKDENDGDEDGEEDSEDEEAAQFFGVEDKTKQKKKFRTSVVDDKFFKLGEMEAFLVAEDKKEMSKQQGERAIDDGINYFADNLGDDEDDDDDDDDDEEDEAGQLTYNDFFEDEVGLTVGKKTIKKEKDHFEEGEDEEEAEDEELGDDNEEKEIKEEGEGEDDEEDDDDDDEDEPDNDENGNREEENENKTQDRSLHNGATDSDDSEVDEEPQKSTFEMRQERLDQRIRDYEDEVLGEKPWQLKGEIQASNRPQNSLLEEILEFESTVRPAPVITEETTKCLEDIIKQRIKDKAWDDVQVKVRQIHTPQDYRKTLVLDQEKSKESLAQIYEKEYQREMEKLNPKAGLDAATEEEPKEHFQIRKMMHELFRKLDALSNFHFTPKPVMPEPKIITNTPAIAMEEVAPVAVSDARLLAPEEVYRGPKTDLLGKSERNRTDKNRERRKKKQKQKAVHKILEEKDLHRQKMGIKLSAKEDKAKLLKSITKHRNVEKITASNDQGALKSSTAFFSKLQDNTAAANSAKNATKRKPDPKSLNAKKLKL